MALQARVVEMSFQLAEGKFGEQLGSVASYRGLPCEAYIQNVSGGSLNSLQLRVYGMSEATMNQLSTLGLSVQATRRNLVTIAASNGHGGMAQVFQGTIANAWIDYSQAPQVCFNVEAVAGLYEQVKAVAVNSYKGVTDVATVIESLARSMGFSFSNNGVTAKLASPYFAGSALTQIKDCAQHAGVAYDISNGSVAIWPSGGQRDEMSVLVASQTGLVDYPVVSKLGIHVRSSFNPDIVLGRRMEVRSTVAQANGSGWYCKSVSHELSSLVSDGPWFTYAQLGPEG
ncbi:hypothetical protein [Pseudomonas sp. GV071]|uniref:baseplate hub protein n=1 Tax=Pseudomonas sp. GV071 TaxID=2135754 RepID=UPI000D391E76|nr:hypothetical protein [Pseudomonas sp. GV071]PTQ70287.1 hypothetical protein C8K61_1069 [Pseudomonas sp. GV071]